MTNCARRWRGLAPQSSEIDVFARTRRRLRPLPPQLFQASEQPHFVSFGREPRQIWSRPLITITRRTFTTAALSLTGLAALGAFTPLRLIGEALAQSAADVAKPVSLPDMALGPADAKVTITEYASMTCPHCAAFNADVFPKIKSEFIDTGKVRYVFREFPLDIKAAAGSMLSRCIANGDAGKYFAVIDLLFRSQADWVMKN